MPLPAMKVTRLLNNNPKTVTLEDARQIYSMLIPAVITPFAQGETVDEAAMNAIGLPAGRARAPVRDATRSIDQALPHILQHYIASGIARA
jgi:dihydrodipicolinate synthase/N-acetylneuraminate lyase